MAMLKSILLYPIYLRAYPVKSLSSDGIPFHAKCWKDSFETFNGAYLPFFKKVGQKTLKSLKGYHEGLGYV